MNDDKLPSRIDRYEPLKLLATGGMAEIFLAKQSGLEGFEKVVVLKRILAHLAQDEEFVSMFLDEARIAAKLSHPNIVQIYDLGRTDDSYYIAMEYVSGRNVQHLISKQEDLGQHLPVEHVCRIVAGVCDGLYYAHSRNDYDGKPLNIIHRDISPQNILVSFSGGVKVVDFGIAKASTQLAQTRAGVLKGKYAYMSPEQVKGGKIDHRSDIFAAGLVMYEMLTGARAFERESSLKTLKAIVQDKPLNPRELNPDLPMEVVKLLSKALEKSPDRRYRTAQEMQLALEDYLESSPKKSNNVRLSRFMYDLFDDELSSAEGSLIVKGVGQVIIPTSTGARVPPLVKDDVDNHTLSAALAPPDPADEPTGTQTRPSRDPGPRTTAGEMSNYQASTGLKPVVGLRSPKTPLPTGADDFSGEDDGKTIPAYDLNSYERQRQSTAASDEGGEDDRTLASLGPPPGVIEQERRIREQETAPSSADAAPTLAGLPRPPSTASPSGWDDDLEVWPPAVEHSVPMSFPSQPQVERAPPGAPASAPVPQPRPSAFFVMMGLSLGMFTVSAVLLVVAALAFPPGPAVVEHGVVVVETSPAGAQVEVDGILVQSPAQVAVPVHGDHVLSVRLSGYQPVSQAVRFERGLVQTVFVRLEPVGP